MKALPRRLFLVMRIIEATKERGRLSLEEAIEMTGYGKHWLKYIISKDVEAHSEGCVKLTRLGREWFFEWVCR